MTRKQLLPTATKWGDTKGEVKTEKKGAHFEKGISEGRGENGDRDFNLKMGKVGSLSGKREKSTDTIGGARGTNGTGKTNQAQEEAVADKAGRLDRGKKKNLNGNYHRAEKG